jgi:trk system potassium uptake protein TrkA
VIISPEMEVANGIVRRLKTPGAFDTVPLADGCVQLLGIHCNTPACSIVGHSLGEIATLLPDPGFVVIGIVRQGRAFVPHGQDRVEFRG